MARRVTDTLESFTIAQAAERWAKDSGERVDLIERKLISAAEKASGQPNLDELHTLLYFDLLHLPIEERELNMRALQKRLYAQIDGLYVNHHGLPITRANSVSRIALEAWCEREGFELPQFLKPTEEELESRVRTWLQDRIEAVGQQLEPQQKKADYRASAMTAFGPGLSKRTFDRIWADTVPIIWRRGGRRKKPKQP